MHLVLFIITRPFRAPTWNQDVADRLLAVAVAALAFATGWHNGVKFDAVSVPLILLQTLPLAWRRRDPMRVLEITGVAITVYSLLLYPETTGYLGVFVAFYTVAANEPRRRAVVAALVTAVGISMSLIGYMLVNHLQSVPETFTQVYASFGIAWLIGDNLRVRRAYTRELEDRAAEADKEKVEQASLAVIEERGRIARELHDVVAHYVSVMVVQAAAARRVADKDPAASRGALEAVEAAGRTALTEMRRMLEVLRADDPGMGPQPGLGDIDRLIDQVRATGLPVAFEIKGSACCLPPGMDLAAYRIVQEALTNTVKHGGKANARVTVTYLDEFLEIEVVDDGRGAAAPLLALRDSGGGHGLIGMKERVGLFGGQLTAGPILTGGYRVYARMPIDPTDSARTRSEREASQAAMKSATVVVAHGPGEHAPREQSGHERGRGSHERGQKTGPAGAVAGLVRPRAIPPMIVRMLPPHPAEQSGSGDRRTREGDL